MKQPERLATDGSVYFLDLKDGYYLLEVTTDGVRESIVMSGFNAHRAYGLLGCMLDIPPSKEASEILMGDVTVG